MENQNFDFISVLKHHWRQHLKQKREQISPQRRNEANTQACQQLENLSQSAQFILSFASFGTEIDLWSLNHILAAEGRLVLPRLMGKQLCLFRVLKIDHLEANKRGFLEPKLSKCFPIDTHSVEIAFIPGLGFDLKTKHRLGYGQGYYDRLLASSSLSQTWGVGFLEQSVAHLPYSTEDTALKQIYLF